MDLGKRLTICALAALLLAIAGSALATNLTVQQQALQERQLDDQRRLVGTSNIAYNVLQDEVSRIEVAAKYLAVNPEVILALRLQTPNSVQDSLLEPYRRTSALSFISLVTDAPRRQIAQAKALSPPQIATIAIVRDSLRLQQDRSGLWDGPPQSPSATLPHAPYAVAASPVLDGTVLVGAVVVGRSLDGAYMNSAVTNNLGDFQAAIVKDSTAIALPATLADAFERAHAPYPYRPTVLPAPRALPLPSNRWSAATWQIGTARFVVVTRPLDGGSTEQLAIALPAAAPLAAPQSALAPLAGWLRHRLALPAPSILELTSRLVLAVALVALFVLLGLLTALVIHLALRPLHRLTARVVGFAEHQSWQEAPIPDRGDFGRLSNAVSTLAREAAGSVAELRVYRDRLQAVLDSMHTGVVVSDGDGHVELINPAAQELLGIDAGSAALPVPVARSPGSGQAFRATNGRVINAVSTPIRRSDGRTMGLVTVLEDMTRERELERVRSDFLTVVSHELRTPLTAVKGSLDLLLEGDAGSLEALQQRFLQTARRNTERLIALVNDLLDLSRLESGEVHLALQPADIRRVIDDVALNLATLFDRKRQILELDLPPQPLLTLVDRRRFEQVVTNLLGNAAAYTPEEGQVRVAARADPEANQTVVMVQNSGPGIAPEDREHLFEKFYRGGNALTRQESGSGLGLAIVKSLVDLHHGTISVESEPGQGASFIVRLPLAGEERENTARR